jgi:hypothetical protein
MTASLPRVTSRPLRRSALLAALAVVAAACSPAGGYHARPPDPGPQTLAAPPATGTTAFFGDEYADRERALQNQPFEPTVIAF